MNRHEFIALIAPYAVEDMIRTVMIGKPVLASYTIAQACIESWNGNSPVNGNYFGVKGAGDSYQTKEFIDGKWITITASFATYGSLEASVIGHSQFLIENPRYTRYGVFAAGEARDWRTAAQALEDATYATDEDYAEMIIDIIQNYDLYKYDREADEMLTVIKQLQDQCQTLLNTAEAHVERINALEAKLADQEAPAWFTQEFGADALDGVIDTPKGPNLFWRLAAVAFRIKNK